MKIKWNSKKYLLMFSISAFILLCLITGSLYLFFNKEMSRCREKEKSFSREILFLRDVLNHRDVQQNVMPLIEGKTPSLIMRGVTNLALKNNVHLVSLAPSGVVEGKEGFYKKATFTAEASAYFKDLGVFLGAIKDADLGIIDISELSVSPSSDNSDEDMVKAKIIFIVYVGKDYDRKR